MVVSWLKNRWASVRDALIKMRTALSGRIRSLFGRYVDETKLEELEEILFEADLGSALISRLMQEVRAVLKEKELSVDALLLFLEKTLLSSVVSLPSKLQIREEGPTVILLIGANGTGKTTAIAKLSSFFTKKGRSVMVAAADTFRAAAQEQLDIWAKRIGVEIIQSKYQADPAAVAFDSITAAQSRGKELLFIDTAGRLENKSHLLKELEKVKRSCDKAFPGAPHEILLVLDATIGQHGIEQASSFHSLLGVTGLIVTKLDGTAKGGIAVAIQEQLGIPVKYIGVGEGIDDLIPFDAEAFVHSLFFESESS